MNDPKQFVQSIGAALSEDGRTAQLQVLRANGQTAYLDFPAEATASILLTIEQALAKVFELQRARLAGHDPRTFYALGAKRAKSFQGAVATDGTPVLSIVLDSGLRMDIALPETAIPELIKWLREFETIAKKPGGAQH